MHKNGDDDKRNPIQGKKRAGTARTEHTGLCKAVHLKVEKDTLGGVLRFGSVPVAVATMGYKHRALDIDKAHLVGNSMGGGVAIGTALTAPTRVDRLVLIATMPPGVRERLASPLFRRGLATPSPEWVASFGNWTS